MTEEARKARLEYQRRYRREHKEEINAYQREYSKKNPEKRKAWASSYWNKKAAGLS